MNRSEFPHLEHLRVRWVEVDMQKIVFNGHYMMYIDTAIGGYWRAMALPYEEAMAYLAGDMYMRKVTLEYEGSARYDDWLDIGVSCTRTGNSSLTFSATVFRGDQRLVQGDLVYVFADPTTQTSKPLPQELRAALLAFESRKPMVEVTVGSWQELGMPARSLRETVFIDEQKIPPEMEWDGADAHCLHAVARNLLGMPVATGRLHEHVPGVAKIGRMAVLPSVRGAGVGSAVLERLMDAARERGDREVILHAQVSAAPFYSGAGFSTRGPVFEELGIPHVEMVRSLQAKA